MCSPSIRPIWADQGYSGTLVTCAATSLRITRQIVRKLADQTGFVVQHRRWAVERTFSRINRCRRTVRDYERRPEHHARDGPMGHGRHHDQTTRPLHDANAEPAGPPLRRTASWLATTAWRLAVSRSATTDAYDQAWTLGRAALPCGRGCRGPGRAPGRRPARLTPLAAEAGAMLRAAVTAHPDPAGHDAGERLPDSRTCRADGSGGHEQSRSGR
jgi:hypothetical protein